MLQTPLKNPVYPYVETLFFDFFPFMTHSLILDIDCALLCITVHYCALCFFTVPYCALCFFTVHLLCFMLLDCASCFLTVHPTCI
jgi:hypothetical protein